jgi:hypothetical protein
MLVSLDFITIKCNIRPRQNSPNSIDAKSYSLKFSILPMRQSLINPFCTHAADRNKLHIQKPEQSIESTEKR